MLIHIKMKSGDDLIATFVASNENEVTIENPIQVKIHPVHGFFAKSWMLLSEANSVGLSLNDITFWGEANNKAIEYYDTFAERLTELKSMRAQHQTREDTIEQIEEVEDILVAYLESKDSIKH
jgi:chromosome segregation ATPase